MTIPTTDYQSDQVTKLAAVPPQRLATDEEGGRRRTAFAEFTVPAGNVAVAKTIAMLKLPAGARLLGGKIAFEAMSTAGGTAQVTVGDGTTAARFLGTTSVDAAGVAEIGNTVALDFGVKLTAETYIILTTAGEAWAATKKIRLTVDYVAD